MDNPTLFGQVKRKLNVTWEDDDTTNRIEEIIDSGIPTMKHRLGISEANFDFSIAGPENVLFKNYCLYEWNHCLNEFWDNYAEDIAQVRTQWAVKYEESNEETENAEE